MSIKVGDKVRFLNAVGGGIVRSFRGKDQVMVEDEDGFEVPALIRECVVVGENPAQVHSKNQPKIQAQVETPKAKPEPKELPIIETPEGERLNVSLAFLPVDPKAFTQSGYEAYLVNDSNYFLFYNYMNRQHNSWYSRANGTIEPNTRIFLEEFQKEDLNELERVCIQLIAFKKDKPYALKNAISVELRLDTVKFYKIHCFTTNDFFDEDALVYPVVRNDLPERELLVSAAELQEAMQQKAKADRRTPQPTPKKKQSDNPILEVDLHINQLLDTTAGMSNADMLNYQLEKFHEVLKANAARKGQKIVFIHGKGDGILRKAIETELKTKYKSYNYQDASFREYGFGATMVTIK
ncbi:DUF2027 domain-containing protein [Parabacteroides sp. PF5-6]|uniref:DUF2027 domain-containing protein n=1 Tax=Parabacteroides sp. PF5-6 TaxID=1742403 RepID=UPI0024052930|nr:DUF2027 domain-containing protein [Parabacteroides sp. PF5-6]MDF9829992.1 hypothetical protein [Parabacteroides sp. PF5-6]